MMATDDNAEKERRAAARYDTTIEVDYANDQTFLFSYIQNISLFGIFIYTKTPLPIGTILKLRFTPPKEESAFELEGEVVWINPYREGGKNINPGMGVKFVNLEEDQHERLEQLIKTLAILPE